jgi:hypothetical protein
MSALLSRFVSVSAALLVAGCLDHPLKDVQYEKLGEGDESVSSPSTRMSTSCS